MKRMLRAYECEREEHGEQSVRGNGMGEIRVELELTELILLVTGNIPWVPATRQQRVSTAAMTLIMMQVWLKLY